MNQLTMAEKIAEIFVIPNDDANLINEKYIHVAGFIDHDDRFTELTGIAGSAAQYAQSQFNYIEAFKTMSAVWCLYGYLLKEKELRD